MIEWAEGNQAAAKGIFNFYENYFYTFGTIYTVYDISTGVKGPIEYNVDAGPILWLILAMETTGDPEYAAFIKDLCYYVYDNLVPDKNPGVPDLRFNRKPAGSCACLFLRSIGSRL